jgi:hypothetical protein
MSERPPDYPIYNECIVTGVLHSFHIFNYFIPSLLQGDTCLPRLRLSSDDVIQTFGSQSPFDADRDARHRPPPAWPLMTSAPIVLLGHETRIGPWVSECEAHRA